MTETRMRVIGVRPGAVHWGPTLRNLVEDAPLGSGPVTITSFADPSLRVARLALGEDVEVEIVPFGRLVGQMLTRIGAPVPGIAARALVEEFIGTILVEVPETSPFFASRQYRGAHRALATAFDELWHYDLDAETLAQLAEIPGEHQRKVAGIAPVMREVERGLERFGQAPNPVRIRQLDQAPIVRGLDVGRIVVLIHDHVSPDGQRWLKWARDAELDVVVLAEDHPDPRTGLAPGRELADALDVPYAAPPDEHNLATHLFTNGQGAAGIDVLMVSTPDPLAECEWALRACLRWREQGSSFEHIGIVVRDFATYGPLLRAASLRLDVPVRLVLRAPLLENAFTRLTLEALEILVGHDLRPFARLAASSYVGATAEDRKRLVEAIPDFQRPVPDWDGLHAWCSEPENVDAFGWIGNLIHWRRDNLGQRLRLTEWATELVDLVGNTPWHDKSLFAGSGTAERDARAMTSMQRAINQAAAARQAPHLGPVSLAEFVRQCRETWEYADCSVPTCDNGIWAVTDASSLGPVDHLIVLGVLEGVFPRRPTEDPILSDHERDAIDALRPEGPALRRSRDRVIDERSAFYRACASPAKGLYLSYPLVADDRDNVKAFYLEEVKRACPGEIREEERPRTWIAPPPGARIAESDVRLGEALDAIALEPMLPRLVLPDVQAEVAKPPNQSFRPDEVSDAAECPFLWFVRYRARVPPPPRRDRWRSVSRIPVRAGLLAQPTREAAREALEEELESLLERLSADIEPWERRFIEAGARRQIEQWIDREFAAREKWPRLGRTILNAEFGEVLPHRIDASKVPIFLRGNVAGVVEGGPHRRLILFEAFDRTSGSNNVEHYEPSTIAYLGAMLLALWGERQTAQIEIDTFGATAKRLLLEPYDSSHGADPKQNLKVTRYDPPRLLNRAMELVSQAAQLARSGQITPQPGSRCSSCPYGELCRFSTVMSDAGLFSTGAEE